MSYRCELCFGTGFTPSPYGGWDYCPLCEGQGVIGPSPEPCSRCEGRWIQGDDPCPDHAITISEPSTDTEARVRRVVRAWTIEGPYPSVHREAQSKLRREWPALALAVEALARELSPTERSK